MSEPLDGGLAPTDDCENTNYYMGTVVGDIITGRTGGKSTYFARARLLLSSAGPKPGQIRKDPDTLVPISLYGAAAEAFGSLVKPGNKVRVKGHARSRSGNLKGLHCVVERFSLVENTQTQTQAQQHAT